MDIVEYHINNENDKSLINKTLENIDGSFKTRSKSGIRNNNTIIKNKLYEKSFDEDTQSFKHINTNSNSAKNLLNVSSRVEVIFI